MKILILLAGILLSGTLLNAQNDSPSGDTAKADASISHATLYFGYGAELTHGARLRANPNISTFVINQLSTNIDINSLQISCPEDVTILSHQFNLYQPSAIEVKPRAVKDLEDSISNVRKEIRRITSLVSIEQETMTRTGVLIEATLTGGGQKSVTSADILKLVEYYNAKIDRSKTAIFNYNEDITRKNERIDALLARLRELQAQVPGESAKPYGQLIMQVICKTAGEFPVSLSYFTNTAGWIPTYDIRVNSKTNKVKLVYKASVTQQTGIDWKKAKLTLSTGTPNFGVAAPVLSPWYLQLYVPELYRSLQGKIPGLNATRNQIQSFGKDDELKEVIVVQGYGEFKREKDSVGIDPSTLQDFTTLTQGQLNTNFDIDLPYDIQSNGKVHSVTIRDQEIDCLLKNYAVPRVDREAYLLAEVADWENLDLLPGDANIIMDNTYIGKSVIDPNVTSDTLNLSLGRDQRLAVKRSVVKELSSLKSSGGNYRQTFTFEITVKNNKSSEVNLLVKDQYPLSTIKEVEVKLEDSGDAIVNEEAGVLTWKVSLKPGESRKFRFTYSVKYPKDKKIMNLK